MPLIEDKVGYAVARLTSKELEVLLRWKGVHVPKMGSVVNRRVLCQKVADGGEKEGSINPSSWTDVDKAELMALMNAPIDMSDTLYGRFLATQKRDVEQAYQHIDAAEREAFLQRLTEINATQSPPSNLTPV